MTFQQVTIETVVNAPVATVWSSWTEPDHIIHWNFASDDWCCPSATSDLRVGGVYVARMEARDGSFGFDFSAVFGEVDVNRAITLNMDDGRTARTTFDVTPSGTVVRTVFDAEGENAIDMQRAGWQSILDNFRKYTETL